MARLPKEIKKETFTTVMEETYLPFRKPEMGFDPGKGRKVTMSPRIDVCFKKNEEFNPYTEAKKLGIDADELYSKCIEWASLNSNGIILYKDRPITTVVDLKSEMVRKDAQISDLEAQIEALRAKAE